MVDVYMDALKDTKGSPVTMPQRRIQAIYMLVG
ncbi:hypothetical protein MAR_031343 [Mya arenaria]|uniref:Uncharacterized protein n=1 Tax=Mya arenaria TaxID=6604 RepID=A0ABY7F6H7_MYAAR|nr:hypothetical protein MAR_031343 [Mya arenaria]